MPHISLLLWRSSSSRVARLDSQSRYCSFAPSSSHWRTTRAAGCWRLLDQGTLPHPTVPQPTLTATVLQPTLTATVLQAPNPPPTKQASPTSDAKGHASANSPKMLLTTLCFSYFVINGCKASLSNLASPYAAVRFGLPMDEAAMITTTMWSSVFCGRLATVLIAVVCPISSWTVYFVPSVGCALTGVAAWPVLAGQPASLWLLVTLWSLMMSPLYAAPTLPATIAAAHSLSLSLILSRSLILLALSPLYSRTYTLTVTCHDVTNGIQDRKIYYHADSLSVAPTLTATLSLTTSPASKP